jgi:hypothetical protein
MTNSDQDNNDSQASPEVEDPITNPGKRETPSADTAEVSSSEAEQNVSPVTSKAGNNNWILIATVIVMLIAIGFFMTGGPEQVSGPSGTAQSGDQVPDDNAPTEISENAGNEGGEFSEGEGGEELPVAGDNRPPSNSEGAESDGGLDSIRLDTEISAGSNEELIAEITDMLLLSGLIGPEDVLSISSETETNGNRIIRLEQTYSGIPVFGGVIVAIENDDVVFNISGETGSDIEVDVDPELSFEEALVIANQSLPMTVSTRAGLADAQLFIINVDDNFHLAWLGIVVIDNSEERVFLDAHDGSVLQRLPINTGED